MLDDVANTEVSYYQLLNIGSNDGLVLLDNKPWHNSMVKKFNSASISR